MSVIYSAGRQVAKSKTEVDRDALVDDPDEHLTFTWLGSLGFVSAREGTWIERRLGKLRDMQIAYFLGVLRGDRFLLIFQNGDAEHLSRGHRTSQCPCLLVHLSAAPGKAAPSC